MTGYDEILILEIEYNIHNLIILRVLRRHNFIHPKNILKSFLASQDKSVFTIQIGQTQKSLLSQVLECARIIPTAFFECIHVAYIYIFGKCLISLIAYDIRINSKFSVYLGLLGSSLGRIIR